MNSVEEAGLPVVASFTNEDAYRIGQWLWEAAASRGLAITIDIRRGPQQIFHAARPGTSADNDSWAARKAALAWRFGEPSWTVVQRFREQGIGLDRFGMDPATYALGGGSVPVVVRNVGPVGTVTVSGLPDADDHALVLEALHWFVGQG